MFELKNKTKQNIDLQAVWISSDIFKDCKKKTRNI